ncbi:DUF1289 domain-containing protein [Marinicellulosiphila megalodicopiae]|uniref:DUF1289 domain-containing protein n=1 Tax=Marinicellulosiphila megalodicopiae TaxID=2724896 RepID=UPI003BB130DA
MTNKIDSPCIRNCCLDEKDMCVGCGRLLKEITSWQQATNTDKLKILENASLRIKQKK